MAFLHSSLVDCFTQEIPENLLANAALKIRNVHNKQVRYNGCIKLRKTITYKKKTLEEI